MWLEKIPSGQRLWNSTTSASLCRNSSRASIIFNRIRCREFHPLWWADGPWARRAGSPGLISISAAYPALKRWAKLVRPFGGWILVRPFGGWILVRVLWGWIYEARAGLVAADDRVGMVPLGRDGLGADRRTEPPVSANDGRALRAYSLS